MTTHGSWMKAAYRAWRLRMTSFAYVTTMGGLVITISGLVDALTPSKRVLGYSWTWAWTILAFLIAIVPLILGDRFRSEIALAGVYVFVVVTAFQMIVADRSIVSANNLVLYPMIACYVGWFFRHRIARATVVFAFGMSGIALLFNPYGGLLTTWVNLALVSLFCMESAGYLRRQLDREIQTDPLTGAMNRSGLDARISQEIVRANRTDQRLALVLLDIDDFKQVNDIQGHSAGDRMLTDLVQALRELVRPSDVVARVGGDEFMILMPGLDSDIEDVLLSRLRLRTGDIWSYGIAFAVVQDTALTLIDRADHDLYSRKRKRKDVRNS